MNPNIYKKKQKKELPKFTFKIMCKINTYFAIIIKLMDTEHYL